GPELLCFHCSLFCNDPAMTGVFATVHRTDVRRVLIKVGPSKPKFNALRVHPFPQRFTLRHSLGTSFASNAHEVHTTSVTVSPTQTPSVVRPVRRSLLSSRDRLSVIVTKTTCDSRCEASVVKRANEAIQSGFEVALHTADHVFVDGHIGLSRSFGIFPCEVLVDKFGHNLCDNAAFAVPFDCYLGCFRNSDGIDLWTSLVDRPKVAINAIRYQKTLGIILCDFYTWCSHRNLNRWCGRCGVSI